MKTDILIPIAIAVFTVIAVFAIRKKREFYSEDHPIINEIRRRVVLISPRFKEIPMRTGKKSYTEDKQLITLCVDNPDTGKYYDINVMMYVALHELAHCLTKADGAQSHGNEFKKNFSNLLKKAAQCGVYDPTQAIPETYCGVHSE